MQSSQPLNTRFIFLVIGAVALLFGGIVGFALTRDGDGRAKPRPVVAEQVKPAPARAATPTPSTPVAAPVVATRAVPPTIDTGPAKVATAPPSAERVPVEDIVSGPWEVVDLKASEATVSAPAAGTTATKAEVKAEAKPAPKAAAPKTTTEPAPVKTAKVAKKAEPTVAEPERVPVVVPAVTPRVTIVESAIATGIADREPVGADDAFTVDAARIWAWIKVKNDGPPTTVTMVWRKGDEIAFRYTLDIGTSPGWRTWSNKTLRAWDAGDWTVDVLDANGLRVAALRFEVADPERSISVR